MPDREDVIRRAIAGGVVQCDIPQDAPDADITILPCLKSEATWQTRYFVLVFRVDAGLWTGVRYHRGKGARLPRKMLLMMFEHLPGGTKAALTAAFIRFQRDFHSQN